MFRPLTLSHHRTARRGTSFILIVVSMLALFAAVGTAYALFAMREARLGMIRKNAAGGGVSPPLEAPDPTDTINRFFSVLIYDEGDDGNEALTNSLRGHSFARSMYGRDVLNPFNTTPWNGVGTFDESTPYGNRRFFIHHRAGTVGGTPVLFDPEYMGMRPVAGGALQPFDATTRAYVGKNAGYSAPDLKDLFLGYVDPATGEVLVQSFHREWLFGSLGPNNPRWSDATGWLYTLRPRPLEHPRFPRVPPNYDGTYTGDVCNLPGGVGPRKNDSIWIDMGLPVITLPGNKKVKPLVAALILPMNGLFDASSHGNMYYGGAHGSHHGMGQWEVNFAPNIVPGAMSAAEAAAVLNARGQPQQRNGTTSRAYAPYVAEPLPNTSAVAWDSTVVAYPPYPAGNSLAGAPNFAGAGFQSTSNPATIVNHPALFNPSEWFGTSTSLPNRVFPAGDNKRLHYGYARTPDWYNQSELVPFAPTTLHGDNNTYPFVLATGKNTQHSYRLDPAHANRMLYATRHFDLDRPKVVPNFTRRDGTNALSYGTGPGGAFKPGVVSPVQYPSPGAGPFGPITDFAGANRWSNVMAALGSVNLNRQLTDYRATPGPLTGNIGNLAQADADRQQLARDIFTRLVVALGAAAYVNPSNGSIILPDPITYTVTPPPGAGAPVTFNQAQYNALRYLAQLSVNIVDYIDNDDISTMFVWNPNIAIANGVDFTSTFDIGNRVVFGHEKTRMVINEAYSEITNDPNDPVNGNANGKDTPPAGPAHVRFWVELLNPTAAPNANGPLGNGSVPLSAYKIEIRRAYRQTIPNPMNQDANGSVQNDYLYNNPANTTGGFESSAGAPDTVFTFPAGGTPASVNPNNGAYAPAANALPANGFVLVGPPVTPKAGSDEFAPQGGVWQNMVTSGTPDSAPAQATTNSMAYTMTLPNTAIGTMTEFKRHIVLLRRLANPYLPAGPTNPYITVDMMDYVQSFDAINRLQGNGGGGRNPRGMMNANPNGFDPANERFAIGKSQPYAGHSFATVSNMAGSAGFNTYTFPTSMVLRQTTANGAGQPLHTFGRHNGTTGTVPNGPTYAIVGGNPLLRDANTGNSETLMLPYDWLVHMDRPLVNQLELFDVRDTPPHRVPDMFIRASGAASVNGTVPGVTYEAGIARWRGIADGIGRGMEFLSVKPHGSGIAHGGRVPGRINVNALPDKRILAGLLDPQAGNGFDANYVNSMWAQWVATRNGVQQRVGANGTMYDTVAAPGQSIFDANAANGNRPFLSFGAPAAAGGSPFAFGAGGNIDQTILRRPNATSPPYLFVNGTNVKAGVVYPPSLPDGPTYYQAEPARKMMNNITTVNHQYVVFLTIGYFDVVGTVQLAPGITAPQLGPETYLNIPGDMRQKVTAVVDMSNMALAATSNTPATETPFFTSLEATARPVGGVGQLSIAFSRIDGTDPLNPVVYVASDGVEMPISRNSVLVLGYGVEQQVVTVNSVNASGVLTVNGMTRTAWSGTVVSNVRPGYPGPQPGFHYNDAQYKPVLPYIERLR